MEPPQRADVEELDDGGDDYGDEGGLGQVLEQRRQEQQGDNSQAGDDDA